MNTTMAEDFGFEASMKELDALIQTLYGKLSLFSVVTLVIFGTIGWLLYNLAGVVQGYRAMRAGIRHGAQSAWS